MNAIDATDHYEIHTGEETPSLLTVVIDTNPRAWAVLKDALPISKAIANILVYVNSHLAFSNANQVAVFAAHPHRAVWLYPSPPKASSVYVFHGSGRDGDEDVDMTDVDADADAEKWPQGQLPLRPHVTTGAGGTTAATHHTSANKIPQFAHIESTVLSSLTALIRETKPAELAETTTLISGALTLALSYINKACESALATSKTVLSSSSKGDAGRPGPTTAMDAASGGACQVGLHSRILVVSVSDSNASQYIPTMNAVFAAAHAGVPVDVLSLRGQAPFLQQGSYITGGTYMAAREPRGLLSYLMTGFASSASVGSTSGGGGGPGGSTAEESTVSAIIAAASSSSFADGGGGGVAARQALVSPSAEAVDFRAACFCHRRTVETAFVCSICLSIFCDVPPGAECLTCGSQLSLGSYGAKPAVVPRVRKKKKRKLAINGEGRDDTGSATGTPRP